MDDDLRLTGCQVVLRGYVSTTGAVLSFLLSVHPLYLAVIQVDCFGRYMVRPRGAVRIAGIQLHS